MKTQMWAVFLVAFCTILTASGQYFYKKAAENLVFSIPGMISNYYLFIGLFLYGVGSLLFVIALKGGQLSVLYPVVSLSFVWVVIISSVFLDEKLTLAKAIGIGLILAGISFVGMSQIWQQPSLQ